MSTHTISILTENHSGSLSRIAGLFSSRGYNISTLTVAETDDPTMSRMTIVVSGDEEILEQIVKQLNKLIDVVKVIDFNDMPKIERELLLVTVDLNRASRHEVVETANLFNATVAGVTPSSVTFEFSGERERVDDFMTMLKPYGIRDVVRSGAVAI
ncbi:acetolactate synthase small subunit [Chitinispirillales bacterium ANBcel5]|uniref:acetolactate synthase small subunit n=1 Tax=Cellulosispirillum alkaliphilum TaxID=3039283 RepID=UPI002A5404AC|nr:acetolactate synthase small subunit [Chitinispirillales bacterium ANBcel5]